MKRKFLGVVAALALFATPTAVQAATITYNYSLNGTYAEDNGNGPSLVPYGGTLAPGGGYYFGIDQGLSLSGTGAYDNYSIDVRFYFDSVSASYNGFQKILDFDNRTLDKGLYSYSGTSYPGPQLKLNGTAGALQCWACPSSLPGSGTPTKGRG